MNAQINPPSSAALLSEKLNRAYGEGNVASLAYETACLAMSPAALAEAREIVSLLLALDVDPATIAAALVVHSQPLSKIDFDKLKRDFGADVADLVRGLQRAGQIDAISANDASGVEALRKMLLAMADDVRVVLIKLAERTIYMRSITKAEDYIKRNAANKTRDLFAPLANRLGVFQIKWELEDLSFRFLEPDLYKKIATQLDGKRGEREQYLRDVVSLLQNELEKLALKVTISGRPKHIFSIHRKMQAKQLSYEKLYDIRAIRVLVDSVADCYAVLSFVHNHWLPVAGEFDDYIAQPKANNYQSLHTAVIDSMGKTMEVQIRTHEMHQASEHGIAAHWRYKEGGGANKKAGKEFESKIAWLRQVLEWKSELANAENFSEQLKRGLFDDTIYVLTPQGRVIDLPAGATPVDFAYHVHTDLGHRCRGAKLDGHIVPLNTPLKNAQRVEILSAKIGGPSRDWINPQLGFMKSPRAMAKVRSWFKQEYFEVDVAHGRQTLERELHRAGATAMAFEKVAQAFKQKNVDAFLAELGRGDITAHQIEVALRDLIHQHDENTAPINAFEAPTVAGSVAKSSAGVLVLGVNNIATLLAKCCKPVPPDSIIGFVTLNRGVMVHRADCDRVISLDIHQRERLMPADWGNTGDAPFAVDIDVLAQDRQGLLRDVSEAIAHERINVTGVNTLTRANTASMRFTLEVEKADDVERVLRAVANVAGVESAARR